MIGNSTGVPLHALLAGPTAVAWSGIRTKAYLRQKHSAFDYRRIALRCDTTVVMITTPGPADDYFI